MDSMMLRTIAALDQEWEAAIRWLDGSNALAVLCLHLKICDKDDRKTVNEMTDEELLIVMKLASLAMLEAAKRSVERREKQS